MNIQVTSINVRRENGEIIGLQVYFTGRNGDHSINLSGYIPLENGEYEAEVNIPAVENIIRQKVVERLLDGEDLTENE